jgi:hypothetical protein
MGLLDWLFGKKGRRATAGQERHEPAPGERTSATGPGGQEPTLAEKAMPAPEQDGEGQRPPPTAPPMKERLSNAADEEKRTPLPPEAENLRRWRESGQARSWVQARQGRWGHADWLALLDDLRRSPFWPMDPEAVGLVLEEEKRQWGRRT